MINEREVQEESERIRRIFKILKQSFPFPRTKLIHKNPFQLFVAVLLSAQTTDEQVNRITEKLFKALPTVQDMARLEAEELEPYLKGCGLYRNKSRFLVESSRMIVRDFEGKVPEDFDSLLGLPGIGRKCANVIVNVAFGKPGLAVDTHVFRVARRLGLAAGSRPEQVEARLKQLLPPEEWGRAHQRLIAHGREVCRARKPRCAECLLRDDCPWDKKEPGNMAGA